MPGFNAETYLEEFRTKATGNEPDRRATPFVKDSEILTKINRALTKIQNRLKIASLRIAVASPIALTAGISDYVLPANRINHLMAVRIKKTDGSSYALKYRRNDWMAENFEVGDTSKDTGEPQYWTFSGVAHGVSNQVVNQYISIRPVPTWSLSGGVIYDYPNAPTQLSRIYNDGTSLSNWYKDNNYISLEPGVMPTFLIGDEITKLELKNTDGTTIGTPSAVTGQNWYVVYSINATNLGIDLITNGTFTGSLAGWTAVNFGAISNKAQYAGGIGTSGSLTQPVTLESGAFYRLTFTISAIGATPVVVTTIENQSFASNGTYHIDFLAPGSGNVVFSMSNVAGGDVTALDNVSLIKLATIQLDRNVLEPSAQSVFQAAQVPDVEQAMPNQIGMAPVLMALADFFMVTSAGWARIFSQEADAILSAINIEEPDDQGWDYGNGRRVATMNTNFRNTGSGSEGRGNWRNRVPC